MPEHSNPDEFQFSEELTGPRWTARQLFADQNGILLAPPDDPESVVISWPLELSLAIESDTTVGLRRPQAGAVHALLGYWTTSPKAPATVVMPTGTGKTDTMVAAMVAGRLTKLLVLVPSHALREQLAERFEQLGVLPALGIVGSDARMPVVGRLMGSLADDSDAIALANCSNVVVSTVQALTQSNPEVRKAFLDQFTHLFIDEAHHVAADTWRTIRDDFSPRPVVQFTATPNRRDGAHLGGSIVYAFPLREAQREGYFSKIRYQAVVDLVDPDRAVAATALGFLREDLAAGRDHLLMARVDTIRRAEEVIGLYQELGAEFDPVLAHSRLGTAELDRVIAAMRGRTSRVLVCVDMFGEGFDLPQLKIAALHDRHRSLGITLQFIGRFARGGNGSLGDATVVAARDTSRHSSELRRLYAEDADWNRIIEDLSSQLVEGQQEADEFTRAFSHQPEAISVHSLAPAMSAVVYRPSSIVWHPEAVEEVFPQSQLVTYPVPVNQRDRVLWFVRRWEAEPRWSSVPTAESVRFDLYVIYWDESTGLLYVHSSDKDSLHERLARAVSGDADLAPISGEVVYRVFNGVDRLTPTAVGLLDTRNRSRRYSSYNGSNVTEAFPTTEAQTKSQTHIAGVGYLDGDRYSIAASRKGRVWSHRSADGLPQLTAWCDVVGPKLIDESISVDGIIAGFIRPVSLVTWPQLTPLALELTHQLTERLEDSVIELDGRRVPAHEVQLEISGEPDGTVLPVTLTTQDWSLDYRLEFRDSGLVLTPRTAGRDASVVRPRSETTYSALVSKYGVRVLLERDAVIDPPGFLLQPQRTVAPWSADRLTPIDWSGVNIRAESWGATRDLATVQGRMVAQVEAGDWEVILDDDGPGEIADIVALRLVDDRLLVHLVHCKFSSGDQPGSRVDDFYAVLGQAQKSANWRRDVDRMFQALVRREQGRGRRDRSGFVRGDILALQRMFEQSAGARAEFSIAIAQPGLSAGSVSENVLQLIGSADLYTSETAQAPLAVFCSL